MSAPAEIGSAGALRARLAALADEDYRAFQCRLMPTVDPAAVLGVRMPALRALAREARGTDAAREFLRELPHAYYDENNLHGVLLCALRDYGEAVAELERFLPHVDNWATCDLLSLPALRPDEPRLAPQLRVWLDSAHAYTVRFALGTLMRVYVQRSFEPFALEWAAGAACGEYYVDMMVAWLFATALAVRPDEALPYLTQRRLTPWVHAKTIQKAVESRRVSPALKQSLRALR